MLLRLFRNALSAEPNPASVFDRFTFTLCMLTLAVAAGVLADYGLAAAIRHIVVAALAAPSWSPMTEADLYSLAAMPF